MYNFPSMVLLLQVVPLSQRSGVLEWCSGTTPIGEFLVNAEEGAHKRYRPKDYSSYQCHKILLVSPKNFKPHPPRQISWFIIFTWRGGRGWNLQRTIYYTFGISNNEYDQWHGMRRYSDLQFSSTHHLTVSLQNCRQVYLLLYIPMIVQEIYFFSNHCSSNRIKVYLISAL